MTTPQGSVRRQLVLTTAFATTALALGLILLVQLMLARTTADTVDQVLRDRAEAISSAIKAASHSRIVVPDSELDSDVVVYVDRFPVCGRPPIRLAATYQTISAAQTDRFTNYHGTHRLLAMPVLTKSGTAVVVLSERLAPYEEDEANALAVSIGAGLILVLVATSVTAWVSKRALAPVAAMAATAAEWSEQDLDQRFNLGPPTTEITALGMTLDQLLDKVRKAILAEQRLTAELAHELRTPLTALQANTDLLLLRDDVPESAREDLEGVRASAERMGDIVTGLLDLARTGTSRGSCTADQVAAEIRKVYPGEVEVGSVGADFRIATPLALIIRALSPLLDNAITATGGARLRISSDERGVVLAVEDDGDGVPAHLVDSIFESGVSGSGGTGLGLPLARRLARSAGGDVVIGSDLEVSRFELQLPQA